MGVPSNSRIPTLDGWRAIAILMVTAFHASLNIYSNRPDILFFTQYGALGVDVFFALSGLLITKLLLDEYDRTGHINLKTFYLRRCFRVLLPCYFYVAVLCSLALIKNGLELSSCLLFFRNYLSETFPGPYTVHLWSLAVEEHFYLLWPPLLVLVTVRLGREIAMWLSVASGLWPVIYAALHLSFAGSANPAFRTDYRIAALLWGCFVAFLLQQSYSQLKRYLTPLVWVVILAAYVACLFYYSPITRLWMPMLLPLLIAGTVVGSDWRLSRVLDSPFLRWIGRLSYSLYLWQILFLPDAKHAQFWWQHFPANIPLALLAATISHYLVENPVQAWGRRLSASMSDRTIHSDAAAPDRAKTVGQKEIPQTIGELTGN